MKWSVGSKIGCGFALALAISMVIAGVSYRNTSQLVEGFQWVVHTHQVQESLDTLVYTLADAETGQRGYVMTGDERYLERDATVSRRFLRDWLDELLGYAN
jgi:CHASE3 domain sensor protein